MAVLFKKGDVVQLKSGGPPMTVDDPKTYDEKVRCTWFAGAKHQDASFDPETLIAFEDSKEK